jgi:hypothetical protein
MKIQVESGYPTPTRSTSRAKYPFATMQVGDSFFMKSAYPEHERGRVSAAACAYAKKHGVKFSTKIFDNGVRTWRIS